MRKVQNVVTRVCILAGAIGLAAGFAGCRLVRQAPEPMGPQYVRVAKIDGRYWFVRGTDRFLSLGCNVVQPTDGSKTRDGRVYNALPKYNNDVAAWAADAAARLKSWNFTTVACWSHEYLYENIPMYHTRIAWLGPWGTRDIRLIDVFSPSYADDLDRTAKKEIAPHATNEHLIGWFLNNELPWYGAKGWPTSPEVSLLSRYMQLPEKASGKVRLVEFLRGAYSNDFAAFSAAWEVDADSFETLARVRKILPRARTSARDAIAWSGVVAEQYFKLCHDTLRRYDPNHLFLGVRFAERAHEPVMAACGKYADVISVNHYRKTGIFDEVQIGAISALAGKPVMITEFSWRAMENSSGCRNTIGADVTVQTQQDRARSFRRYATNALAQPFIVGYDWFMYHDQPPAGRFDGEDSNYGLVDIQDNFYTELLGAITEINGKAEDIHQASPTPLPDYNPAVLADFREITIPDGRLAQPVALADSTSHSFTWADTPRGSVIEVTPSGSNSFLLSVKTGSGWGCGVTFKPPEALPANPDGSVNAKGGRRAVVTLKAAAGVRFSVGLQESGHGPIDSQTFGGYAGADGESYVHKELVTEDGLHDYVFEFSELDTSPSHGNQRGNKVIDSQAFAQVHLFFPGGQKDIEAEVFGIRIE